MRGRSAISALVAVTVVVAGCSSGSAEGATVTDRKTVVEFVDEAVAYAQEKGKDAAISAFNDPKGPFQRGELYVYAYDFNGNVLANGGNRKLVGQNLLNLTTSQGERPIEALVDAARKGSGWVQYTWPNPLHDKAEETKFGYAKKVDDTWWLGSGTYAKAS